MGLGPAPVRAAEMPPPQGIRPKDFTLVKNDGVYHLFYIRHNDFLPSWATENDFGHAVSTDLYHWTQLPPVLGIVPGVWDNLHVWAPHVVRWGGVWWMFYTGVTEQAGQFRDTQRIGAAVSSDLMTWSRVGGGPVWTTSGAPWALWAPLSGVMACRDPFVMPDPAAPGQWLLYYTATPANDTLSTLIGVARSPEDDPTGWVDEKPLWITHYTYSFNSLTESPHLLLHNGHWFMFITTNAGQPISFFVGSSPTGDPAQWSYRGRHKNMLGFDTSTWFASESLRDGDVDLFAFVANDHIEVLRMNWGAGDNFSLAEPDYFHMVHMNWTRPIVRENQFVGLKLTAVNGTSFSDSLVAWTLDAQGREIPAPLASLGLPSVPNLANDSTVVAWFAKRWPDTLPASEPMALRVAMSDGTATTPWLAVYANPIQQLPFAGPGGTAPDQPAPEDPPQPSPNPPPPPEDSLLATATKSAPANGLALRVLDGSPLGGGPALLFELAAAGRARLELFDLQGRKLVTLADRAFPAGTQAVLWDGHLASGARARRGLYFVRLVTPARVATTRLWLDR